MSVLAPLEAPFSLGIDNAADTFALLMTGNVQILYGVRPVLTRRPSSEDEGQWSDGLLLCFLAETSQMAFEVDKKLLKYAVANLAEAAGVSPEGLRFKFSVGKRTLVYLQLAVLSHRLKFTKELVEEFCIEVHAEYRRLLSAL